MSALANLIALAAGERPRGGLTQACRLEAFGAEHHGEEQIVSVFRAAPFVVADSARIVQAEGHLAILEKDKALVADVAGDVVVRVWRLDAGAPRAREQSVSVPFDPDLNQARGDLNWCASDHPAADPVILERLAEAGVALARAAEGSADEPYRIRTFLIRAFSEGEEGVGLFAVHRVSGGVRIQGWSYALVHLATSAPGFTLVRDRSGEAAAAQTPWRVHLV
jgi:hypothetical protein